MNKSLQEAPAALKAHPLLPCWSGGKVDSLWSTGSKEVT